MMVDITPEKCGTCNGTGEDGFDRDSSHAEDRYVGYPCPTCHGKGYLYPPALVERIALAISGGAKGINYVSSRDMTAAVAVLDALNTETP